MSIRILVVVVVSAALFSLSCSKMIALEGSAGDSADTADTANTANSGGDTGVANTGDTGNAGGDTGNTGDTGDTGGDTGDAGGDTGDTGGDTGDTGDAGDAGDTWSDDEEDPDADAVGHTPYFPEGFDLSQCECGDEPVYEPVCCNKNIEVYNICFANCFAHYSNPKNTICDEYTESVCAPSEPLFPDADILFDEDNELPDIDTNNDGEFPENDDVEYPDDDDSECDCALTDFKAWCCNNGIVYIGKCAADCGCPQNYLLCPSQ